MLIAFVSETSIAIGLCPKSMDRLCTAWLPMSTTFWPTLRFYYLSPLMGAFAAVCCPVLHGSNDPLRDSLVARHGGEWKGRLQDARNGLLN